MCHFIIYGDPGLSFIALAKPGHRKTKLAIKGTHIEKTYYIYIKKIID
jgi:hypothetical protein